MRTAAFLAAATVCGIAGAQTITVREYLERLEELRRDLKEGNLERARRRAGGLLDRRIRYREGWISPDRTVLARLKGTRDIRRAKDQSIRLGVLAEALRREGTRAADRAAPDPGLLEELRRKEELAEIEKGGRTAGTLPKGTRFTKWLAEELRGLGGWIADKLGKLLAWLEKFWPKRKARPVPRLPVTKLVVTVLIAAAAIALVFVVYYVLRKGGGRGAPLEAASSGPAPPARDDDALSRSAAGWVDYAAELAAAGRVREATRAWYHAVLVTLYRAGFLHYRKGRTNWEYAYSLSPELPWRPRFIDVTRRFEREWYGRETGTLEGVRAYAAAAGEILHAVRGHSTGSRPRAGLAEGRGGR